MTKQFVIAHPPFYFVPAMHYTMECAAAARKAFLEIAPDCVAVELPETAQESFLHATSRLPDVSIVTTKNDQETLYFPIEPCDASLEALRSAQEAKIAAFCIDLDIQGYPMLYEALPDPYAITKIGLKKYYEAYVGCNRSLRTQFDRERELHMAKRLKGLSFSYEKILVVAGFSHINSIITHLKDPSYPQFAHVKRDAISLCTYPEEKARELLAEYGWITTHYESWRENPQAVLDRQKLQLRLLREAKKIYEKKKGHTVAPHIFSQILRFMRNWAFIKNQLLADLYQIVTAAKACVDHSFAYEVWKLATDFTFYKNVDSLPEEELSLDELWGGSKKLHFHLKAPSEKSFFERRLQKERSPSRHYPPHAFSICSYPPEDSIIEAFASHVKKRAESVQLEMEHKTQPFTTSLEDGIDIRETIRHFAEKKLYVKKRAKPPGQAGSCVMIFEEEKRQEQGEQKERYPCTMTWIGEHDQESDMAFYATSMTNTIVGPGISRCSYGGLLLSYPNRRLYDVWQDPDYTHFTMKHEVLLAAAIDYSKRAVIVYIAHHAPDTMMKKRAERQGKKIIFMPLSTFPKREREKLQTFHILDGQDKRKIADEYIY